MGLNLTLPIHNRVAQADVARDELQVRQAEVRLKQLENQIRVEAEDSLIALGRTRAAYEAAVATRKLQEESSRSSRRNSTSVCPRFFWSFRCRVMSRSPARPKWRLSPPTPRPERSMSAPSE